MKNTGEIKENCMRTTKKFAENYKNVVRTIETKGNYVKLPKFLC